MQLVKGHTCLHKLASQSMSPPPGTSILAIALPRGTSYEPKARGWPWGGAQLELTDTLWCDNARRKC